MGRSWVGAALLLVACSKGGQRTTPYTCADMARHGVEVALAESPTDRRASLEDQRAQVEASLRAGCDLHHPSQEALACFATAADRPAFMACGAKYFPDAPGRADEPPPP